MPSTQTRRIGPSVLRADQDAQIALAAMADYQPANPAFSREKVAAALADMQAGHESEILAQTALDTARDAAAAAEWCFHDIMLGVKQQIVAQYGESSDQLQSLGLKKKTERKRPVRAAPVQPKE